jgi:5-methylcytosine-specific restriction endonuclease McrA
MPIRCLAVSAAYEPLRPLALDRALRLVLAGKAEIVLEDEATPVRSAGGAFPRPAVIRLVKFVKVPRCFRRRVTNTWLFARDGHRCGYCGRAAAELRAREFLTRDHVVPRSRGGGDTWTNVVTACNTCNGRKGDRTPDEAARIGLALRVTPTVPHLVHLAWNVRTLTALQARWVRATFGEAYLARLR